MFTGILKHVAVAAVGVSQLRVSFAILVDGEVGVDAAGTQEGEHSKWYDGRTGSFHADHREQRSIGYDPRTGSFLADHHGYDNGHHWPYHGRDMHAHYGSLMDHNHHDYFGHGDGFVPRWTHDAYYGDHHMDPWQSGDHWGHMYGDHGNGYNAGPYHGGFDAPYHHDPWHSYGHSFAAYGQGWEGYPHYGAALPYGQQWSTPYGQPGPIVQPPAYGQQPLLSPYGPQQVPFVQAPPSGQQSLVGATSSQAPVAAPVASPVAAASPQTPLVAPLK